MKLVVLFAFLLAFPAAAAGQLSPAERRIAATVEAEEARHVDLLERLVNVNSGTLNLEGNAEVARLMRAELEPLGFTVEWIPLPATGRAGHLVATHRGDGEGAKMLLIGHLDTVFEPDSPFQRFERQGERAVGPGVGDMKGGLVIMIAALRAMHQAGTLDDADIKIVLTGDEERPGAPLELARRDLIEAGKWADIALEFENLAHIDGREYATVARRSSTSWTLRTSARSGHSSGIFSEGLGYGAVYEIARIIDAFRRELPEQNLTYNVGVIGGGTPAEIDEQGLRIEAEGKTNIVASTAIARGDLRTLTAEQDARVRAKMQEIVAHSLPHAEAELVFSDDGYPPMEPTAGNRAILVKLNEASRDLALPELGEYDPARRGAADSSFVAPHVDTLAALGAMGGGAHGPDEWIYLDSLPRQAKRVAVLMSRLAEDGE